MMHAGCQNGAAQDIPSYNCGGIAPLSALLIEHLCTVEKQYPRASQLLLPRNTEVLDEKRP